MKTEERLASLRMERHLAHPPEDVWGALTDPDQVMQWMRAPRAVIEGGPNGQVEIDTQLRITGRILTWDPPRVFEHEFQLAPSKAMPGGEDAVLRYELQRVGEGCRLTVTFTRLTAATARRLSGGMKGGLDRLEAHLSARYGGA